MSAQLSYQSFGSTGVGKGSLQMISPARVRLYFGPDHLLQVEKLLIHEHYHRLYFRDLQALLWVKTKTWLWHTLLLAIPCLLLAAGTILALGSGAEIVLGLLAGALFLFLLDNLRRGPTCRVFLKTPLQYVELPSVKRVKEAQRLLQLLRPWITQYQSPHATPPPPAPAETPPAPAP
ncbi:MAG: hypothetical protein N3J91_13995 [Verrucomicrobiae bacterium]|nr:hypothetical protein [Verrucomicrobiae bacterium]